MNRFGLAIALLHFIILLLAASNAHADAAVYESDEYKLAHSQLTLANEDEKLQDSGYKILQDESAQNAPIDPFEDLRQALEVMQSRWFKVWAGTWPTAIDWTRAVVDTYLVSTLDSFGKALHSIEGLQDARDDVLQSSKEIENDINQYFTQNVAYYFGEDAFTIRNEAYDDMLWVVLGWLESVKFVKAHSRLYDTLTSQNLDPKRRKPWHGNQFVSAYAHRARVFWEFSAKGWDTRFCGGGMIWNPYLGPYKNAITNELFISASVSMYLYFPGDNSSTPFMVNEVEDLKLDRAEPHDPKYLKAAVDGYDWLKGSNMTNEKGLYVDGFHISNWRRGGDKCDLRNDMVYTYNQGVLLSGLRGLWESTGNISYLEDGHELARNSIKATGWLFEKASAPDPNAWAGLGRNGILEERCDAPGRCNQDAQTFKGIFFHHLTLLCEPLPLKALVPGKTYAADKELVNLHRQSCREYTPWVLHNAKAALNTRDVKGRFGMWWGARNAEKVVALPDGAVDYRNNASELLNPIWTLTDDMPCPWCIKKSENGRVVHTDVTNRAGIQKCDITNNHSGKQKQDDPRTNSDLNDRGRGRTVETQGGGVAVLRALWELLNVV